MNEADIELLRKQAEGHPDEDALERIERLQDLADIQHTTIEDLRKRIEDYKLIAETAFKIIHIQTEIINQLKELLTNE